MHETFWPHFPILIPASPGVHFGWQVVWWLFQIVVMGGTLILLQRIGIMTDEERPRGDRARGGS
jgi:hypothetical protein